MIWPFEFRLLQGPYATQQRNFEELCALLIRSKHPNWRIVPRESPDWGIDFLAISPRKVLAFQCKFFIDSFGDVSATPDCQVTQESSRVSKSGGLAGICSLPSQESHSSSI